MAQPQWRLPKALDAVHVEPNALSGGEYEYPP